MDNESVQTWCYAPLYIEELSAWAVVEDYGDIGTTEPVLALGEDLDDLVETLAMMLHDVEAARDAAEEEELSETCLDCIQSAAYEAGYADGIAAAEERN